MSAKLNVIAIQLCVPISQAECFVNQVNQYLPRKMTYKAISKAIRSLPLPDRKPDVGGCPTGEGVSTFTR